MAVQSCPGLSFALSPPLSTSVSRSLSAFQAFSKSSLRPHTSQTLICPAQFLLSGVPGLHHSWPKVSGHLPCQLNILEHELYSHTYICIVTFIFTDYIPVLLYQPTGYITEQKRKSMRKINDPLILPTLLRSGDDAPSHFINTHVISTIH